jgi:hypothetical protein
MFIKKNILRISFNSAFKNITYWLLILHDQIRNYIYTLYGFGQVDFSKNIW